MKRLIKSAKAKPPSIELAERHDRLPLSLAQQRLWFLARTEQGCAYHIPFGFYLKGELEHRALCAALDQIIVRHEVLRTTFTILDGAPVQKIAPSEQSYFQLIEHDLRNRVDAQEELVRLTALEADTSFDLEAGSPIRGRLIRLAEDEHALLITIHGIASDCWSIGIFKNELSVLYSAFKECGEDPLPKLKFQYADYAVWQRLWTKSEILQQQAAYWKTTLAYAPAVLQLPTDYPRPAQQRWEGDCAPLEIDAVLATKLKELSRRHGATLFMTLLAAWVVLLSRLTGQLDVVIGIQVANRARPEFQNLIGHFVNTLALRINLSEVPTVTELLQRVKGKTMAALQHQDIPLEQVAEIVPPERGISRHPMPQIMFAWQNVPRGSLVLQGLELRPILSSMRKIADFDLTLTLRESGTGIEGGIDYAVSLFERATIERYLAYYQNLLNEIVVDDAGQIDNLPVLSENKRRWTLSGQYIRNEEGQFVSMQHRLGHECGSTSGWTPELSSDVEGNAKEVMARDDDKVDLNALPVEENVESNHIGKMAPIASVEEKLLHIWADVLKVNVNNLCVDDNFFELGGQSLHLMQVSTQIRRTFREEVTLNDLFQYDTIASLAKFMREASSDRIRQGIEVSSKRGRKRLSFSELSVWLLVQLSPVRQTVNGSICAKLQGDLNVEALEQSITDLVRRHESLRTTYRTDLPHRSLFKLIRLVARLRRPSSRNMSMTGHERSATRTANRHKLIRNSYCVKLSDALLGALWSIVVRPSRVVAATVNNITIPIVELSDVSRVEAHPELDRLCQMEWRQPMDLSKWPLFRAKLFRINKDEHVLLLVISRAVADGTSLSILRDELRVCYEAHCIGKNPDLQALSSQYTDYVVWKGSETQQRMFHKAIDYWRNRLKGMPKCLEIPFDGHREPVLVSGSSHLSVDLSEKVSEGIRKFSQRENVTLFITFLAAYKVLLHVLTGEEDIVVGAPFTDRSRYEVQGLVGHFTTGVLFRTSLSGNPSFREIVTRLRREILEDFEHADSAAIMIGVGATNLLRLGGTVVSAHFNWTVYESSDSVQMGGLRVTPFSILGQESHAIGDLDLVGYDRNNMIRVRFVYKSSLFSRGRIQEFAEHFQVILSKAINNDKVTLAEYRELLATRDKNDCRQ